MSRCKPIVLASILGLAPVAARADDPVLTPGLAGMGGAAVAASTENAAIRENPGLLGVRERYDIHAHFQYGPEAGLRWAASAVDTRTSKWLAMGLYYWGDRTKPPFTPAELPGWKEVGSDIDNLKRHHELTAGLGVHGWDRRFGFGINGTFSIYNHEYAGKGSTGNLGAGLGGRPTEWLDLGVAGRNLVPVKDIGELPMSVGGGARVHGEPGALLAEVQWRDVAADVPFVVAGGGEIAPTETARLRLGYRYEGPIDQHALTTGLSAVGPGGTFDLSARIPLSEGAPPLSGLSFAIGFSIAAPDVQTPPSW